MKYFVYSNKTDVKNPNMRDRALYFVPENDLRDWASKFDPSIMEFCGVEISAESREEAQQTFLNPIETDGFDRMQAVEEPLLTRVPREQFGEKRKKLAKATTDLMVQRLATLWTQIDEMFRAMAQLYVLYHDGMIEEQAYTRLKKHWLKKYSEM